MSKKQLTYLISLVIVIVISFLVYKKVTSPIEVKGEKAEVQNFSNTLVLDGTFHSENETDLAFEVSGRIVWIGVKEGDNVFKGEALAQIDTRSLKEDLNSSINSADSAQIEIYEFDEIHKDDRDDPDVIHARNQLSKAKINADVAVEKARITLSKANIYSPIKGTITGVEKSVGEYATAGVIIISVSNKDSKYIFKGELDEEDISFLKIGDKSKITLDAYGSKDFNSQITKIMPKVVSNDAGEDVINIELEITENLPSDFIFVSGLNGEAKIILDEKEALGVPFESILQKNGNNYVYVYLNGRVKLNKVEIGEDFGNFTEIIKGIKAGDLIITEKVNELKDGQKIKIKPVL